MFSPAFSIGFSPGGHGFGALTLPRLSRLKGDSTSIVTRTSEDFGGRVRLPEDQVPAIVWNAPIGFSDVLMSGEQEGTVMTRHGRGTFLAGGQAYVKSDIEELTSITGAIRRRNWTPGTMDARMHEEPADEELAERLQVGELDPVIHIERVRTADSVPVFYSIHKAAKQRCGDRVLAWNMDGSFLEFPEGRCGIYILYAVTAILPVPDADETTRRMGVSRDVLVLLLDPVHYDVDNRLVFRSYDYYRADVLKFHTVRRLRRR